MEIPTQTINSMLNTARQAGYIATESHASTDNNFVVTIMVRNKTEAEKEAAK